MNKHTATLPDGQIVTRNSASRTYSHVIAVAVTAAYKIRVLESWTGSITDEAKRAEHIAEIDALKALRRSTIVGWRVEGWAGRPDLAEAQLKSLQNKLYTARAIPAEIA
jgi:hypothetical protein